MSKKPTTRDLVSDLVGFEIELEYATTDIEHTELMSKIDIIKSAIVKKTEGIDYFMVKLNRQTELIDAEIRVLTEEVKRLRNRKKAVTKTEEYFKKELLPMIIETAGNDGKFETKTARYTMFETYGPVIVMNEDEVPDKYKRFKIEIDKKGARADLIAAAEDDMGIAGFETIRKVKRVRRS